MWACRGRGKRLASWCWDCWRLCAWIDEERETDGSGPEITSFTTLSLGQDNGWGKQGTRVGFYKATAQR
ncbi:hypothetical protein L6452_22775 [Arctium lappa]|uniref:Uncharacterized protein n=1 Tax=Arctium lappa TaxID=4217 RepID=A0ACB9B2G6_ARCLA|nr:hypothetical protein L6452_22775 [Arctium lappa]